MCARCKLAGLAALVNRTPEPRPKTKDGSLALKIKWVRREPTKVQKVERQVKLEELG
jgi:hypothetical protein